MLRPFGVLVLLMVPLAAPAGEEPFHYSAYRAFDGRPVGTVVFEGNGATRDYIIRRELETVPGKPFSVDVLQQDLIRLENLGLFGSVKVGVEDPGDSLTVTLTMTEVPSFIPFLSIGYTEENGFSIGPAMAAPNLFGRGIAASGKLRVGGQTTFSLNLEYPWITGNHIGFAGYAAELVRDDELNEFRENSTELTPRLTAWIGKSGRAEVLTSYFIMRSDVDGKTLSPDNRDDLVRIGGSLGLDTRDTWRNPRSGWLGEVEVLKTGGYLPGDGDWTRVDLDMRRFFPTGSRHKLAVGGLGSFQSGTVGRSVPEYMQFRLGGANSVRGYDVIELGKEQFGKNQLILTAEFSYLLVPLREFRFFKWGAKIGMATVLFSDTGVAWSQPEDFNWDRRRSSIGAGLRLLVPGVDMLRFEVGYGEEGSVVFHFGAGSKFDNQRNRIR